MLDPSQRPCDHGGAQHRRWNKTLAGESHLHLHHALPQAPPSSACPWHVAWFIYFSSAETRETGQVRESVRAGAGAVGISNPVNVAPECLDLIDFGIGRIGRNLVPTSQYGNGNASNSLPPRHSGDSTAGSIAERRSARGPRMAVICCMKLNIPLVY